MERIQTWLFIERQVLDNITNTLTANLVSLMILVGTFAMAAVPALMTGISVYFFTIQQWGQSLALLMSVASGVGIEAVGISSAFVALKLYNDWRANPEQGRTRLVVSISLAVGYAIAVGGIIVAIDNMPRAMVGFGAVSPWLALMLYTARGLYQDVLDKEAEKRLIKNAEVQAQVTELETAQANKQELALLKLKLRHEEKMATLQQPVPVQQTLQRNVASNARATFMQWVQDGNDPSQYTDTELANMFGVNRTTIWRWKK